MSALNTQVGGSHYKDMVIQPVEFCQKNKLTFIESCVIKYVCRHRAKNGRQDIEKAIHFLNLLLEMEYPEKKCSICGHAVTTANSYGGHASGCPNVGTMKV